MESTRALPRAVLPTDSLQPSWLIEWLGINFLATLDWQTTVPLFRHQFYSQWVAHFNQPTLGWHIKRWAVAMDKLSAFVVGSISASVVVAALVGFSIQNSTAAFLSWVAYLLLCGVGAVLLPISPRMPKLKTISSRQVFWMPYIPLFLMPLWLAVVAYVYEWKLGQPALRYFGISVCAFLTVPSLLLHVWLSGLWSNRSAAPNHSPKPTQSAVH